MPTAFGTIAAKPELPYARVLAQSFRDHHRGVPFFVLLADEIEGCFDPAAEPYELVLLRDLRIPDSGRFRFVHPRLALSYAATPYLLEWLLDAGFDRAVFIKQESLVLGEQGAVVDALEESSIVLTPHLLEPVDSDAGFRRELTILKSGVFNGGLVGVSDTPSARAFLTWWGERVARDCRHAVADGMHYEQRWLDLVPAFFEKTHVLRDPAANVGHWNLPERRDAEPTLLRFSGFDPDAPDRVTRYDDRVTVDELGPLRHEFRRYARKLHDAGWAQARRWPYAFDRFDDGTPIPDLARDLYREAEGALGEPFATGPGSFFSWLNEPARPRSRVSRLWQEVHRRRPDVQAAYPDPFGADEDGFVAWTAASGLREHTIHHDFLVQ